MRNTEIKVGDLVQQTAPEQHPCGWVYPATERTGLVVGRPFPSRAPHLVEVRWLTGPQAGQVDRDTEECLVLLSDPKNKKETA